MAKKIGEILIEAGLIDERQLELALAEQRRIGGKLGAILAELGFTTEEEISRSLADQCGVEHCDLEGVEPEPAALDVLSGDTARRLGALPLRIEEGTLVVAMANPRDIVAIDEIQRGADLFVRVVAGSYSQVIRAIDRAYARHASQGSLLERIIERAVQEIDGSEGDGSRGAVVELVDEILQMAIRREATDVHIQPDRRLVRVRLRIDGDLTQGPTFHRELLASVVARIKVLAHLDISESRVPQDGKIRFPVERRSVDLRVSTYPSVFGESIVVRILDRDRKTFSLENLGLDERGIRLLERAVQRPNGLILAAGPTGSGKSTTLYALVRLVNASERNVITVEDPVEYEIPLVTQSQVNERAGLTFASGLRAILRHDPDVILVGEIRDSETAAMALRAALTGHLVLSTIHTNDAVRSVARLIDMGMDSYIVASCLAVVAAQRLVRRICASCRTEYVPRPDELAAVGLPEDAGGRFARGKGCELCGGTGNRGREAIFEVLEVGPLLAQMISRNAHIDEIETAACEAGMVRFSEMAQRRAQEGRIALEEVARVAAGF